MATIRAGLMLILLLVFVAACGGTSQTITASSELVADGALKSFAPRAVSGTIAATGSSTVYPLTLRMAREFRDAGSPAEIRVGLTGTGAGFRAFCSGAPVDLVNASRAINAEEAVACRAAGREPVGFQIGVDALAVVVPESNTFLKSLSFGQLQQIFSGAARTWDQLDPSYPPVAIAVFSPGADSGTFDFFVDHVLDGDDQSLLSIPGIVTSEDDEVLLKGIVASPYAIGYFGYAYYKADQGRLRALAVDSGEGEVVLTSFNMSAMLAAKEPIMLELTEPSERATTGGCCTPDLAPRLNNAAAKALSEDLTLLGHPIRLQILDMLAQRDGQVCVCDLEGALPVKQPTVSHHLKLLREAGLIDCERRGLWAYYFVKHEQLAALRARILGALDAVR